MKYSIRGNLMLPDVVEIVGLLNRYSLWRLLTSQTESFSFEVWVNTADEKNALFADLKPFVDQYGESIDWHECTHDEASPQPCIIAETYVRG